jgi:glycerophosphoryl diester phosphodiesterase
MTVVGSEHERLSSLKAYGQLQMPYCNNFRFREPIAPFFQGSHLWLTADDVWVCHHDRTLDRVTDMGGAIPEMTLSQVKRARVLRSYCGRFDQAAYPDERVPTLKELLALMPSDKGLALELKDPRLGTPEQAARLVAEIRPQIAAQMAMLLAFDVDLLWAARAAAPEVWVGEISEANPNPTFAGNGIGTSWQAMQANPHYMDVARAHGLWVCPLDPSPEERLDWYLKLDVDAVLSDDPARTRAALALLQGDAPPAQ